MGSCRHIRKHRFPRHEVQVHSPKVIRATYSKLNIQSNPAMTHEFRLEFKIVPREGDKVRIYVQMSTADKVPRREDGRVDKSAFDPNEMQKNILQVNLFYFLKLLRSNVLPEHPRPTFPL